MVSYLVDHLFYEDTPACILFGIEINNDLVCDEIARSIDALFYTVFIAVFTVMLLRLIKMSLIFIKVIEYLLILRTCKSNGKFTNERKFIALMKTLQAQNESYFSVWEKRLLCKHNVESCNECDNCKILNGNNKILCNFFSTLFERFKPQTNLELEKGLEDVKLIFINDKYCAKSIRTKRPLRFKDGDKHFVYMDCDDSAVCKDKITNTSDIGVQGECNKSSQNVIALKSPQSEKLSISQSNSEINDVENLRHRNVLKNKYLQKIFHLTPTLDYPQFFCPELHKRIVLKKLAGFAQVRRNVKAAQPLEIKKMKLKSIELADIPLVQPQTRTSNCQLEVSDKSNLEQKNIPSNQSLSNNEEKWEIKRGEAPKVSLCAKVKETQRKNLMNYIEKMRAKNKQNVNDKMPKTNITTNKYRKTIRLTEKTSNSPINELKMNSHLHNLKSNLVKKVNFTEKGISDSKLNIDYQDKLDLKQRNPSLSNVSKVTFSDKIEICDGQSDNVSCDEEDRLKLKFRPTKSYHCFSCPEVTTENVRDEIFSNLVNLPKDTISTLRYRYKMHRNIKDQLLSSSKNSLDIIPESSSKGDLVFKDELDSLKESEAG